VKKYILAAGSLLFLSGLVIVMGISTAEALYPATYVTSKNVISDLGGPALSTGITYQPSAAIFNWSMILTGLMVIAAYFFLFRAKVSIKRIFPIGIMGLGILGAGAFPLHVNSLHLFFSVIVFIFGGISLIFSSGISSIKSFRVITTLLGIVSLCASILDAFFPNFIYPILGRGGIERWIVYPIIAWLCIFGGYLIGDAEFSPKLQLDKK
jgi:hypothetical membrane protein